MGSNWIPDSIVIKPMTRSSGGYAYYTKETYVRCNENSIFSEFARIDTERAKKHPRYIHLRFRHSNKYWSLGGSGEWIVAVSDKPEEDPSKESCTLFEANVVNAGRLLLRHVQSDSYVTIETGEKHRLFVVGSLAEALFDHFIFDFVNWQTLFKMPARVALRGNNQRWLRATTSLQFSSQDHNERESAFEIELNDDGHIRIKSAHLNRYLRRDRQNNLILADALETDRSDDVLFWPVLVRASDYAFRSKGNNNFCRIEGERLSASASTMSLPATFKLQELVLERHVYHTRFRMDEARIYDETVFIAGTGTSINNSDHASTLTITISYQDTRSYSFSNSTSTTEGITTTISTGFPRIFSLGIEMIRSTTKSFEWGETLEETKLAEASVEVMVPARSGVRVDYVGTQGTCSIPFNYTQRDKSSSDGHYTTSSNIDGIFTGVNYYSFHFEQHAVERLTLSDAVAA